MLKAQDFDAARDAAIACVWSDFNVSLTVVAEWHSQKLHLPESAERDLDDFQELAAAKLGKLAAIYQRADSLLTKDLCEALVLANCGGDPPTSAGRPMPTWHQAAVDNAHQVLAIPYLAQAPLDDIFGSHVADGTYCENLGSMLAARTDDDWKPMVPERNVQEPLGAERRAYWARIVYSIRKCKGMGLLPDDAETRIQREWANARNYPKKALVEREQPFTEAASLQRLHNRDRNPTVPIRQPNDATHSPDFTAVSWYGKSYLFTPTQARAIKILWNGWETGGATVSGKYIVTELDIGSSRTLAQVFRRKGGYHDAWGKLIVPVKGIKGAYCLNDPNDPALQVAVEEKLKAVSPAHRKAPSKTPRKTHR